MTKAYTTPVAFRAVMWAVVAACFLLVPLTHSRAEFFAGFESADITWRMADRDTDVRVNEHRRVFGASHSGQGCELVRITAGRGTFVNLVHQIPHCRIFAEWMPSIRVRADRTGIQIMARLVLPRTIDPQTRRPITTWLRGDLYARPGVWQQLAIRDSERLVADQIRALRWQHKMEIDSSVAYVDAIGLNIYGGVGDTSVWIDDLHIPIHVAATPASISTPTTGSDAARQATGVADTAARFTTSSGNMSSPQRVVLRGSNLIVDERPFFPRAIQHNGESLQFLKSLGFNAVRFSREPTSVELHEAERLDLWLVAPPPANLNQISSLHERVLAWDLGSHLTEERLNFTQRMAGELRRVDPRPGRPLICQADRRVWNYSRIADLAILDRQPIGSSMEMTDYGDWIASAPRLMRPGTPVWAAIQVDPMDRLVQQWQALGMQSTPSIEPEQIRLLAYHALASGARGLLYKSRTPLDAGDPVSQLRARVLHRLNLEAELFEPWAAGGARIEAVADDDPSIRVGVLQTERAQMLIVLRNAPGQQYVTAPAADESLSLIAPSLLSALHVYRISSAGLRTQPHRRVAGGVRITLDSAGLVSLITTTQDALVMRHLTQTLQRNRRELSQLQHEIAARQLDLVEQTHRQLVGQSMSAAVLDTWLVQARANLRHCETLLGAGDEAAAQTFAERSLAWSARVRRAHWEQAAAAFPTANASPFCTSFSTLPDHWQMVGRLRSGGRWSTTVLPAGDFESLQHLQHTGWRNLSDNDDRIRSGVELTPDSPRSGQNALRLTAWPADPGDPPTALESPPVQIVSPAVPVRRGQLVRIHGWANVPAEISASVDRLMITDSISGEALAARIGPTGGWQEFVMYRIATDDRPLTLAFALTGFGEATIDDVTVTVHGLELAASDRQPFEQAKRFPPSDPWHR